MVARAEVAPGVGACEIVKVLIGMFGVLVEKITITYFWLFYSGVSESVSIDVVSTWHRPGLLHSYPLLNNSLLLLFFCLAHSILARKSIKNLVSIVLLSDSVYRHFYLFQSSLLIFLICYGWTPHANPTLWDIQFSPLREALHGVCFVGLMMNMVAFFSLPVLDFIGVREPLEKLTGRRSGEFLQYSIVGKP
ncbi:hypothetical protein GBAR_LOCUS20847 [Geodia barretti]|uniref:Nuclear envelope membrane protein n=1 Tax=Geodia barretti TaxID=519541 RepID=A0AA35SX43_GEOBA|nr:hypothetical protein GBAR_LOCUS20847 [Geodia barretti]